jgi:hypothetical protein
MRPLPFDLGVEAYHRGYKLRDNPFDQETEPAQFEDWDAGWEAGADEDQEVRLWAAA